MNCCNTYGDCTQGRDCPARSGVVLPHQARHAARTAPHHVATRKTRSCDELGVCKGAGDCSCDHPATEFAIQFIGPEPVEPTGPLDDCMPLTPREERQIMAGMVGFLLMFLGLVYAGLWFGWAGTVRRAVAAAWSVVLP